MSKPPTNKDLIPFGNARPLVPGGKGGGLKYWRQERENEHLNEEIADMAKTIRRMTQELVESIIYVQAADHSFEARQREVSRLAGAIRQISPTIMSMFQIEDIHPALARLVAEHAQNRIELSEQTLSNLPTLASDPRRKVRFQDLVSNREFEILTYRLAGYRNGEIAAALGLASKDVSMRMTKLRQLARRLMDKKESIK